MIWALLSVGVVHTPIPCMLFLVVPMSLVPGLRVIAPKLQGPRVESLVPVTQLEASKPQVPGSHVVGHLAVWQVVGQPPVWQVVGQLAVSQVVGQLAVSQVVGQLAVSQVVGQLAVWKVVGQFEVSQVVGQLAVSSVDA
ncbi:hypothetical protein DPMN_028384 [Dreissena polymorpha]|uniref:Uncharacterized protein n=1 Tax=Dreissena polymorpha TaxID=45954 RepID=A0A9D4LW74_DREPO|nr:hypothetical protein DPMN_028384 [Dreissena polymorpha]